jgi:hypothetical protein
MAGTYRVTIDLQKVRANMHYQGRQLSEGEIESWLKIVGFVREDGGTWLSEPETLRCLDESEIVRVQPAN